MILVFSGTIYGMTLEQKFKIKEYLLNNKKNITEIRHGDIIGGDEEFHRICFNLGLNDIVCIYPSNNRKTRALCKSPNIEAPRNPYTRKFKMLDNVNILVIAPNTYKDGCRYDVWSLVKIAKEMNILIDIIFPDGKIERRE